MTDWLGRLYERLWRKVGGRPWTEIIRDDQKSSPLLFLLIFLALGVLAGRLAGKYLWQLLIAFVIGLLCGHFWW